MRGLLIAALLMVPLITPLASAEDADELAIREAALRRVFAELDAGGKAGAGVYCVGTTTKQKVADPDESLLKRFADNTPPVKKVSACQYDAHGVLEDKATGKWGLLFTTGDIKRTSDTEAEVQVLMYNEISEQKRIEGTCFLKKTADKWVVEKTLITNMNTVR